MPFTAPRKLDTIPAARIDTSVTSARPIMSADAVDAVRCGLRRELSRASAPAAAPSFVAGQPSVQASGPIKRTDRSATPKNTSNAPPSISSRIWPVLRLETKRPASRPANPSAVSTMAAGRR